MKAMMCFNGIDSAGLSEGFQGIPAPLLPIANKPLVEYYIELCSCLHIHEFLILDSDYSEEAAARLGDGSRWSVKVIYRGAESADDIPSHQKTPGRLSGDGGRPVLQRARLSILRLPHGLHRGLGTRTRAAWRR